MQHAMVDFVVLAVGGAAIGVTRGFVVVKLLSVLKDEYLAITTAILPAWISYILAESLDVSGVIATVSSGMIFGCYQNGFSRHPPGRSRLREQYSYRTEMAERLQPSGFPEHERPEHFAVVLAGLAAARFGSCS